LNCAPEVLLKNINAGGGRELTLGVDSETNHLGIEDQKGQRLPYLSTYWFVWKEIPPEAQRYSAKN